MAADYCQELTGLLPRQTDAQQSLFKLLDYAYIGARYDRDYKITKEQLYQLGPCVKQLQDVAEKCCIAKINSFTEEG